MKKLITILLTVLLAVPSAVPAFAAETARSITISKIEGSDVTMTKGTARSFTAKENQKMANGYTVTTGKASYCWLKLDEDSIVKMDQNSTLQFGDAKSNKLSISVLSGAITVDTAPQKPGDAVEVRAGNSALAVRGTIFVVENLPSDKAAITMLTGGGSVNGMSLNTGEVMYIYDTEEEKVIEVTELVINESLSLSVLGAVLEHIGEMISAGAVDAAEALGVTSYIEGLIEEKRAQGDTSEGNEIKNEIIRLGGTVSTTSGGGGGGGGNTQPSGATQDDIDIAAAKTAIVNAAYTATQANVSDIAQAKAAVETIIGGLQLNGVTATVADGVFSAATAGTPGTPAGTNGSYTFTVTLSKGSGTQQTTAQLTLTITATPDPGDGSQSNPFKVATAADLRAVGTNTAPYTGWTLSAYYEQTADIDLEGVNWTPIGKSSPYFTGSYDGANKEIRGLSITASSTGPDNIGLFGRIDTSAAIVENVNLVNVSITVDSTNCNNMIGGVAGNLNGGTISNCTVSGSITDTFSITTSGYALRIGGVVGYTNMPVTDCSSDATVSVTATTDTASTTNDVYAGGVAGQAASSGDIEGCSFAGSVRVDASGSGTLTALSGGVVGYTSKELKDCSATGSIGVYADGTGDITVRAGGVAGSGNGIKITDCTVDGVNVTVECNASAASDAYAGGLAGGGGGVITNSDVQSADVSAFSEAASAYAGGVAGEIPRTSMSSNISGCTVDSYTNITAESKAGVNFNACAGGIVGIGCNIISGCSADATVNTYNRYGAFAGAGGIIGSINGSNSATTISNCSSAGVVTASSSGNGQITAGGIAGRAGSAADATTNRPTTIEQCSATGYVKAICTGNPYAGGVLGCVYSDTNIQNCDSTGNVEIQISTSGGGVHAVGGVVGCIQSGTACTVEYCSSEGNVIATNSGTGTANVGGIVGYVLSGTISTVVEYCCVTGDVISTSHGTGSAYVGGVLGRTNSTSSIRNCCFTGNADVTNDNTGSVYIGGVVGCIYTNTTSTVEYCYAAGNVNLTNGSTGSVNIGGIVGEAVTGQLNYCVTLNMSVTASGSGAGPAVGRVLGQVNTGTFDDRIASCFASSDLDDPAGYTDDATTTGKITRFDPADIDEVWWTTDGPGFDDNIWDCIPLYPTLR